MCGNEVENLLKKIGSLEGFKTTSFSKLHGGSINQVLLLETSTGKKVIKLNGASRHPTMFRAEKKGLDILKSSKTFDVPTVFSLGKFQKTAYLLLEYIPSGKPSTNFWNIFAEKLADLHHNSHSHFGFSNPNYIGSLPQFNKKETTAAEFYIHQRLEPQFKLAAAKGFFFKNLEIVYKNISNEIPEEKPALIHGDLWNGNYLVSANGLPCLIDPAVSYGPREMDLAMMRLFGGFPQRVFLLYDEIFPLVSGAEKRTGLWQLYYLLVHLNLFGSGYLPRVNAIVRKFN